MLFRSTVSSEDHPARTLYAGDAALFRAGTWSEWHVEDYVRKHAILRQALPAPLSFVMKVLGSMRYRGGMVKAKLSGTKPAPARQGL